MGQIAPNRLEDYRKNLERFGITSSSANIICASWSEGTKRQYQAAWTLWYHFCNLCRQNFNSYIDPFNANIGDFLKFLTEQFDLGKSYSILNSYRSAISTVHSSIEGFKIGQHPIVVRFFKGLINLRPVQSRYSCVWHVELVLKFLRTLSPLRKLDLKMLTMKLVGLMALVTAQRAQTMISFDISKMFKSKNGVTFLVDKKLKTSKPGFISEFFLQRFTADKDLCIVTVLEFYLQKTENIRFNNNQLFLSFMKPHKPVTSASLARWLIFVLSQAGVDTDIFRAHSFRAASASCARRKGVSITDIMKTANWKSESVFLKFYNKSVVSNFSKSVLKPTCKKVKKRQ